jgi:MacB-like periplasmic core domain
VRMLLLPARERVFHAQVVNDVLQRVRALPQVVAAGSIGILPMNGSNSGTWYYRADQPEPRPGEQPGGDVSIITPGYFQAMAIPLLKGRDFDERDRMGSPKVAILNQTAARMFFADQDPLGKRVSVSWNVKYRSSVSWQIFVTASFTPGPILASSCRTPSSRFRSRLLSYAPPAILSLLLPPSRSKSAR